MHDAQPVSSSLVTALRRGSANVGRSAGRAGIPPRDALVNLMRSYVVAHVARPIEIAELVMVTGVSEAQVRRAVATETGEHLAQFVANVRLDEARAWLLSNRESRSQAQIAAALGFMSSAAFGRTYRRRFGETVGETRRRVVNDGEMLVLLRRRDRV